MAWFTADLHFGHKNVVRFRYGIGFYCGQFTFTDSDEHDEYVIERWNNCGIQKRDTVFVLGDVAFNGRGLDKVKRLVGKKILIMGNHDEMPAQRYLDAGFVKVYGVREYNGCILSHIPIAQGCVRPRYKMNIHGHLHATLAPSAEHRCVSLEQTCMRPIHEDELRIDK